MSHKTKQAEEKYIFTLNSVEAHISPRGLYPMVGTVQDVGNSTTLGGCAGAREGRCQRMTKDAEQFTTHAKMMRTKKC